MHYSLLLYNKEQTKKKQEKHWKTKKHKDKQRKPKKNKDQTYKRNYEKTQEQLFFWFLAQKNPKETMRKQKNNWSFDF